MAKQRLTQKQKEAVRLAFFRQFKDDRNLVSVAVRYSLYDGEWLDVHVLDLSKGDYPEIYEGMNVFLEKSAPFMNAILPQS